MFFTLNDISLKQEFSLESQMSNDVCLTTAPKSNAKTSLGTKLKSVLVIDIQTFISIMKI